ncbi:MBL fold metallo-hydrolase [Guyparkeria sp.]|uniref:MBL fold metallo-hydrolase n=1 Tax=Guyparkeria sp. TaxID=2035736 RepID=UPI003971094B
MEIEGVKILVDCGLFQGGREIDDVNEQDFGFAPRSIAILLLTHAHLDHCGRIPLLVKSGPKGEIIWPRVAGQVLAQLAVDACLQQTVAHRPFRVLGEDHRPGFYPSQGSKEPGSAFQRSDLAIH